jgi:CopG family nickel-responsive transcriptional regulator
MSDLTRLTLSLPRPLLARLEGLMRQRNYTNRSEFLRDLIRDGQVAHEWQAARGAALGIITLVYQPHLHQLSEKLTTLQHHSYQSILASTRVYLDQHVCAEVLIVHASPTHIQQLADHLRQQKGVLHATLSTSSTGQHLA